MSGGKPKLVHAAAPQARVAARKVSAAGILFAYRELGSRTGVPLILLNHLGAVLDNWDPHVIDGLASQRWVIVFDNRGVGATTGTTPRTIQAMAADAVRFIKELGLAQVDLFGFSMGGMIAQVIAQTDPVIVRRMILVGTGTAGGPGITDETKIAHLDTLRSLLILQDPKQFLFFTRTENGRRAGKQFLARLNERKVGRGAPISVSSYLAQLAAIRAWELEAPHDLSTVTLPVLVANGDAERTVPTTNSVDLAHRFPNSELVIYPDAGHGGVFQNHAQFVERALAFLQKA